MTDTILSAHNLTFSYRNDIVLNDVSFSINKGDFVALIGANGSGKSTLLKILLGFLKPVSGSLSFRCEKTRISYIPQGGIEAIDFLVSVQELLMFRKKKSSKQEVEAALKAVGMQDYAKSLVKNLSGGQRQRVLIARELMSDPEMLFLDEPTNGLDSESIKRLQHLLIELNRDRGMCIVMVTHHIDEVFTSINRVLELKDHQMEEKVNV